MRAGPSTGRRVAAVLIGGLFLLIALAGVGFVLAVIDADRCSQISIAEALRDPDKRCVNISATAQTIYAILGWSGVLAALLVLPASIVYAARGRAGRLVVIFAILAVVLLLGGSIGLYLLDAKAKVI
jgi:hypothetical protein